MSDETQDQPRELSTRTKVVSALVALAALAWLAWVVERYGGVETIRQVVARLDWTWPFLLLPYGLSALVLVFQYRSSLPDGGRAVPFFTMVQIERSGSALNSILPLGDSSGNIAKVALLRHWYTSDQIVAAAVWSSIGTGLSNAVAALGPLVGGALGILPPWLAWALGGVNLLMAVPAILVLFFVRKGLAARVASLIARFPARFMTTRRFAILAWAERLDVHVASAVGERRVDFARLLAWKTAYQLSRVVHLWIIIALLDLQGGLVAALAYNAMTRPVQQLLVFVPGRLGVSEELSAALYGAIGWPAADGLAVALVLRFNFIINVIFSGSALSTSHVLAQRFPPRSRAELEALEAKRRAASD